MDTKPHTSFLSSLKALLFITILLFPSLSNAEQEFPTQQKSKWFMGGAIVGLTYNDFYNTNLGLANLKSTKEYSLKTEGSEDLLGNYWGIGANIGASGFILFSPIFGINANLELALRRGNGESDVTVKLYWKDETQQPEKSDLNIEYYAQQVNIDFPITARFILPNILYAEAGPLMSFNVYSHDKSVISDIYGTKTYRNSGDLNVFEFGLIFGLGTMHPIGYSTLDFNLRFALGLTSLTDANDAPKTWQWQFNIGYWFI